MSKKWALLDPTGIFKGGVVSAEPPTPEEDWRPQEVKRWPIPGERWDVGQNDWVLDDTQRAVHAKKQEEVEADAPLTRRQLQQVLYDMLPQLGVTISEEQRKNLLPLARKK